MGWGGGGAARKRVGQKKNWQASPRGEWTPANNLASPPPRSLPPQQSADSCTSGFILSWETYSKWNLTQWPKISNRPKPSTVTRRGQPTGHTVRPLHSKSPKLLHHFKSPELGLPRWPRVKKLACSTGNDGSIPGQETKIPCVVEQQNLHATTRIRALQWKIPHDMAKITWTQCSQIDKYLKNKIKALS